jgi:Tfp pilus assembly protein PilN
MKHLFNFSPTVKFRKGSSFLYKVILSVLYFIPAVLLFYHGSIYLHLNQVESFLNDFSGRLENRHSEARTAIAAIRPDRQQFWQMLGASVGYHRLLTNIRFSWSTLFDRLEDIIPPGVKIARIRMKPAALVNIAIEGEAADVTQVTEFLRRLYGHPNFTQPRLARHSKKRDHELEGVAFQMEAGYLIDAGEME